MNSFKEVTEIAVTHFSECPLGRMVEGKTFEKLMSEYDKPLWAICEKFKNCPIEGNNGHWENEYGNSIWHPDGDYVPPERGRISDKPYSNPDKLSWKELLEKYGMDGIPYKDGEPDFSKICKGEVEIAGFETGGNIAKVHNFSKADIELAKQKGCTPEEVKNWRTENNYTWHECKDMKTMQLVPNEIHANVSHSGGRSQKSEGGNN